MSVDLTRIEGTRDIKLKQVVLDRDAVEIGDLYRKACSSVADSVRYLIEAGQRLLNKKASLGRGEWLLWLEANAEILGFDTRRTAARLMEAAVKWDASVSFTDQEAIEVSRTIWGHNVRGTEGTGKNEWFTPQKYFSLVREALGAIDLDPATHEDAQAMIKATRYFTKADNGLEQEWRGRVWLNPPYAPPLIDQFVAKMIAELQAKHVMAAIMLTHSYTSSSWYQLALSFTDAICFASERVRFYDLEGEISSPTQGQTFFYFGAEADKFVRTFRAIGLASPWTG